MDKILDRLYLGSIADYRNGELEKNGITAILCLAPEFWRTLTEGGYFGERKRFLVDINDGETVEGKYVDTALNILNSWMKYGETIFIHCAAGISRSPTMTIAYLTMAKEFASWEEAERHVWSCRPVTLSHPAVKESIKRHLKLWPYDGSFDEKHKRLAAKYASTWNSPDNEEPVPPNNNDPSADA
jgi:hypothetical protein